MCDTIGKIINEHYAIFGKNSDRAVNEPQLVEFYEAKDYGDSESLKCTYITIPQARHTHAIVLSRPEWIWGGEIGVNEFGVCIGNEAVFTKGKYGKDALIGMDLLRLGLERAASAKKALDVIIDLLTTYGQGGNCGFDSNFHYDNSFLIMDAKEIYILDTKDKDYCYKKVDKACISNCLNIEEDGDFYKQGNCSFTKKYSDFIMTTGAKGKTRRQISSSKKLEDLKDMMDILSSHNTDDIFSKGSVSSICMHASNSLTADETTMSMIVELIDDKIQLWLTGCSLPCISLYKGHEFKANGLISNGISNNTYWKQTEQYNRRFLTKEIPMEFYEEKRKMQETLLHCSNSEDALLLEKEFYARYNPDEFKKKRSSFIYRNFWIDKNSSL